MGAVLMVQGCASSVGKSLIVTGLCRLFHRRGVRVAPFKAQNLALNSFVTREGHEIGRAQVVQAEAAGIEPTVDMNPILLKPEGDSGVQVVVMGKPLSKAETRSYFEQRDELSTIIGAALERLRASYDLVLIEGAGSPAEINLRERDLANMHVARLANAPVLLVGDIDRGGVFAHLYGTLALLESGDRARVAGLLINKFRGDPSLIRSAIEWTEAETKLPVLGVLPYLPDLRLADEDSLSLEDRLDDRRAGAGELEIVVVRLPYLSNHDDFLSLEREPGVVLRYVESPADLGQPELVILPGTKNTRSDLGWLRESGWEAALRQRAANGQYLLGICGGYQMLGGAIEDPHGVEGEPGSVRGLELLPVRTHFKTEKTTRQVSLLRSPAALSFLAPATDNPRALVGYEIHMGEPILDEGTPPLFLHAERGAAEGVAQGSVAGTLLHGLFDNAELRADLLRQLRSLRSLPEAGGSAPTDSTTELDRLADMLEAHLDLARLELLLGASWTPTTRG